MLCRAVLSLSLCAAALSAAVPTPAEHLGYPPGADFKLASYDEIIGYFRKLAASSPRVKLAEYGRSSEGRPLYVAFFSSPENLARLERYREISRRLALGEASREEAEALSREGKAIVWIDSGLHATETAPSQHAPELAWRMVSDESPEMKRIRDNVILMQIPCINPDGLDMVVNWYRRNVGTRWELAPLPGLYQKYAGHDNNRDWFMMNLPETRHASRLLFQEWFPQIVYNQHQAPAFPARIFVPPYAEPLNPNIPAPVMEGINLIGAAMKERFARENKPGVLSYYGFDAWWNGGLRSVPAFHNMHGILTETALHGFGTPKVYNSSDFPERFGNGMPSKQPTVFYERPWMGGRWGTREAIGYMLTADMAILDLAASRADTYLLKAWQMARDSIETGKRGGPYGYIVPQEQWDRSSAIEMLRRLQMGGLQVQQAEGEFTAAGAKYPKGTWFLPAAQPFRSYLVDLMEPQRYPEIRSGEGGAVKRPYDVTGWTLPMLMGVNVQRVDERIDARFSGAGGIEPAGESWDQKQLASFRTVAGALKRGESVRRAADGAFLRPGDAAYSGAVQELRTPRVGLYTPWNGGMDAGWTEWVLDTFDVPFTTLRNNDVSGELRERFDAIILPEQSVSGILHGWKPGQHVPRRAGDSAAEQRPEYSGGIGLAGAAALERFVREGGTLLTFGEASALPVELFGLPLRQAAVGSGADALDSPGSILRVTIDPSHPVAWGMPSDAMAFQSGQTAWEIALIPEYNRGDRAVRSVAKYANKDVLASGWLQGERRIAGKTALADVRWGKGRVVLFGFRPQFRGQTFGTFRLLLNALYVSAAKPLNGNSSD